LDEEPVELFEKIDRMSVNGNERTAANVQLQTEGSHRVNFLHALIHSLAALTA